MTAAEFRELALSLPGAIEGAHMGHADFRAHGRIFATLGYPNDSSGMVKLPPAQQKEFILTHPHICVPAKGAWGLQGSTLVSLTKAHPDLVQSALDVAWQQSAATSKKTPRSAAKKPATVRSRKFT